MTAAKRAPARSPGVSRAALARMSALIAQDAPPRVNPFARATHPPGVEGKAAAIAQDDALGATAGWAFGQVQPFGGEGVGFLGFAHLTELSQRPEYRRIVETISNEMVRRWIRLTAKGDEDKSERMGAIEAEMRRLKVRDAFRRAIEGDGYFGRGHVFIDLGTSDPSELTTDIGAGADEASKAKIARGSFKALRAVEALWVYPTGYDTSNPLSPNWYKPGAWMVQGRQVHASRLLTMVGRELPDLLKPSYSFGGLALSQMAKPYVDNWLRTRQSVSDLVASFSVSGIKTDLTTAMSSGDAGEDMLRRVQFFTQARANLATMVLDKGEDFFNVQTALGTLDKLQAQSQEQVGSAVKIPLVKFTGLQPSGLNASSEGELDSFYDDIHGQQEQMVRPPLTTVIDLIQLSLFGDVDPDVGFEFEHLQELDEAEAATVSKTRADTDVALVEAGILMPEESRKRIATEFNSPYAGLDLSLDLSAPAPGEGGGLPEPPGPSTVDAPDAWRAAVEALVAKDAEFKEGDHPRGKGGRFGSGGSGATGKSAPGGRKGEAKPAETASNNSGHASKLYEPHARTAPATDEGRKARGAEIAEKMGATERVEAARQKLKSQASTDAHVSKGGHRQDDGSYTPERRALHEKLLSEVFTPEAIRAATPAAGAKPVMTMLGGRGGSGKSWLTGEDGPVDGSKTVVIDADHFKGRLPEYRGWNAGLLHEESSHLVDRAAEVAEKLGLNVVFDATMKSAKGAEDRIRQFEAAGHDIHGYYMFASPETATERAMGRFVRGGEKGRFVPPEIVMANTENEKNFDSATPKFKKWGIYDNNGGGGTPPRHVASGENE